MITNKCIKISTPGSAMILGEHAVLHGYPAVVCAANHFVHLTLIPRGDDEIHIDSALGEHHATIQNLAIEKPFTFVLTALKLYQHKLKFGFDLKIESEFSHEIGLGSSAAVTVAMIKILKKYLHEDSDNYLTYEEALRVIRAVQGLGSGADVAASVFGGVIKYQLQAEKALIESLPLIPHLSLFYSGSKMPTPEVLQYVRDKFSNNQAELKIIYENIGKCTDAGIIAIKNKNWIELGKCFNAQQKLMTQLGVTNAALQALLDKLENEPKVLGTKISGSGLGDCVLSLGVVSESLNGMSLRTQ